MTDRELMQQALEALEFEASGWEDVPPITRDAITALRERLVQPEQPVECMCGLCKLKPKTAIGALLSD